MNSKLRIIVIAMFALLSVGMLSRAKAQQSPQANPTPAAIRPDYKYSEAYSCTGCHFVMGAGGEHNLEAVGVHFDDTAKQFLFTGSGWLSARHSQSNHVSTQNTFCSKCHAPLQATPQSSWRNGIFKNTDPVPDGATEGITCATCHPSHTVAAQLGRRLGVYQWGKDRTTADAYKVVAEGDEDTLCLNCHQDRHNTDNPAFFAMYSAGVRCIDCHMAVYGAIATNPNQPKREHDWAVAKNLPFSCGVQGSIIQCHPGFSVEGTKAFIPYIKEQHNGWQLPQGPKKGNGSGGALTAQDYMSLWQYLDGQATRTQ